MRHIKKFMVALFLLIKRFIIIWNEFLTIPLAMILWAWSDDLIRMVDKTAAAYDGAIFQKILFAMIAMLFFNGFAWLMIKINFPRIYEYLDNVFETHLDDTITNGLTNGLSTWEKAKICLWLFSLYFLALVLMLNARF